MLEIKLVTSNKKTFHVTICPETGSGVLHPTPDTDKVRIKNFELDNEDNLYDVDWNLNTEWSSLLKNSLEARAILWLNETPQLNLIKKVEELDEAIKAQREIVSSLILERDAVFYKLHKGGALLGGFTLTQYCFVRDEDIKCLQVQDFHMREY